MGEGDAENEKWVWRNYGGLMTGDGGRGQWDTGTESQLLLPSLWWCG